ncbi:nucleoside monophosphate kinase [Candidatus Parcubacteria bacterium]|nr:nucleoside monophosphate kinase [Candidatus Parcubacteria bacterium]
MNFPIFKTKTKGANKKFDLTDPKQRSEYFELKAGDEIKKIRKYLDNHTFIIYFLGKKNSGKGTYAKMFAEIVAPEKIFHFSIGDMIREIDKELRDDKRKKKLISFLEKNYRGWQSLDEIISVLESRSTKRLLPTELILALVKREIARQKGKAIFIDGFPRELDQISFSLFFRDLVDYREDPDIFVLIDVPEKVIDERIKWRRVCPVCQTSRNLKLLPTSKVGYNKDKKEFFLICDNPKCKKAKMLQKEGDESGIGPIKERLNLDETLIKKAFSLYGIPKILLRNSIPANKAKEFTDDYEITPEYCYQWDEKEKKVKIIEKPWIVRDEKNLFSYSLMPPPVVLSFISQMVDVLKLR